MREFLQIARIFSPRRENQPGGDRVHLDRRSKFERHGPRDGVKQALTEVIGIVGAVIIHYARVEEVDDVARSALFRESPRQHKRRQCIGIQIIQNMLERGIEQRGLVENRRIVDQDVNGADRSDNLFKELVDPSGIREVAADRFGLHARFAQLRGQCLRLHPGASTMNADIGAFLGQQARARGAQSPGATRDERGRTLQHALAFHGISPRFQLCPFQ